MVNPIEAISIPDEEKAVLFDLLDGDVEKFYVWQKDAFKAYIQMLAQQKAASRVGEIVRQEIQAIEDSMPSLFSPPVQESAEPVLNEG